MYLQWKEVTTCWTLVHIRYCTRSHYVHCVLVHDHSMYISCWPIYGIVHDHHVYTVCWSIYGIEHDQPMYSICRDSPSTVGEILQIEQLNQ